MMRDSMPLPDALAAGRIPCVLADAGPEGVTLSVYPYGTNHGGGHSVTIPPASARLLYAQLGQALATLPR